MNTASQTASTLRSQKSKDLAQLAKSKGISGWHSMRKEQLIRELLKIAKQKAKSSVQSKVAVKAKKISKATKSNNPRPISKRTESRIAKQLRQDRMRTESLKNLALVNEMERTKSSPEQDRIILIVRDPYWVQAYWEITNSTIERVRVALSDQWYSTKPVLRLVEVNADSSSSAETVIRQIPIHGGVRNWFVDVPNPPKSYRVQLGYASDNGKFFLISSSNIVTTPTPDHNSFDLNWADIHQDHKKYYAMSGGYSNTNSASAGELQSVFEEKMRRPMNAPAFVMLGNGLGGEQLEFDFEVDAHMIIEGKANPNATVTLSGEPVNLRNDGSFTIKMDMPDKRQVLPIVASSRDGTQRRTTVLAVERNTKKMEPVSKQLDEL